MGTSVKMLEEYYGHVRSRDVAEELTKTSSRSKNNPSEILIHLARSCRSSVVEHTLGKGEVLSSILSGSTIFSRRLPRDDCPINVCYARWDRCPLLARQMGTFIEMIEHHYSHPIPRLRADKLAGKVRVQVEQFDKSPYSSMPVVRVASYLSSDYNVPMALRT